MSVGVIIVEGKGSVEYLYIVFRWAQCGAPYYSSIFLLLIQSCTAFYIVYYTVFYFSCSHIEGAVTAVTVRTVGGCGVVWCRCGVRGVVYAAVCVVWCCIVCAVLY